MTASVREKELLRVLRNIRDASQDDAFGKRRWSLAWIYRHADIAIREYEVAKGEVKPPDMGPGGFK